MDHLSELAGRVSSCNKCGLCQEVCPTYKATGLETDLARGRNRLILDMARGHLDPGAGPGYRDVLYGCLLCGACGRVCPSEVKTHELVLTARADLARRDGLTAPSRVALRGLLTSPSRLGLARRALRFYESSGTRALATRTGALRLLGRFGRAERLLGSVPPSSLRGRLTRSQLRTGRPGLPGPATLPDPVAGRRRRKVAYFLGCLTDNFFPEVGEAVLAVLSLNGYKVDILPNACCGVAHQAYGDLEGAATLARRNLDVIARTGADIIVTDCASCAHTLTAYPDLLGRDDPHYQLAVETATRVREVCQFLAEDGFERPAGRVEVTATYHDPCHLVRSLGVKAEPRFVLGSTPGVTFTEMAEPDWCCGGAGSFNVTHHDLSTEILDRKMSNFRNTGATLLATCCPSCLLQLGFGLRLSGLAGRAVHPVQLLWEAYRSVGRVPLQAARDSLSAGRVREG